MCIIMLKCKKYVRWGMIQKRDKYCLLPPKSWRVVRCKNWWQVAGVKLWPRSVSPPKMHFRTSTSRISPSHLPISLDCILQWDTFAIQDWRNWPLKTRFWKYWQKKWMNGWSTLSNTPPTSSLISLDFVRCFSTVYFAVQQWIEEAYRKYMWSFSWGRGPDCRTFWVTGVVTRRRRTACQTSVVASHPCYSDLRA